MRTPSGELHVVDFKTEQIVASIQPKDYWDDKRHWEIKNNIDTLEFRVFDNTKHSATLMQQNLVLKEVRDGRIVPYVITEIEKDSDDRSVIAYASGEWVQLAKAGIIPPQKLEGKTVIEMVDITLAGTKWKKGNLEYASFRSMTIDEFIDPLTLLKKIASLFELEIQYRAEVIGSQVVGRYVDMVKKRGRETGKEVTLGKDLMGIKRIENSQNICTALLGFVKKEGGEFVTITEINNGVPYLVDSDAFQRWNEKGQHKFGFYSPETEDQDMNPKRLMTLMNTELKKRVNTSVSYEVQAQSIGRVFGLAHELINEGDTIRIKDTGFTPKLYLEARTIAGDESFKDPTQDKYVFGDYHEIVDPNEELRKIYNRILSSLGNKQEMIDQLDKLVKDANETASNAKKESEAAKTLAEKVQENIKNNTVEIIESKNPPTTGLKPYKTLWRDISNGKPGILKIWTGTAWESVVPDVESVKKETLDQVNKDIESTKTELNKKVQEAQNQATGQVNEVKESLQGVSRTISNVENKQGVIDKKVNQFEQDSSGFKQSIESLTKKDTEISNKLNTVETTVEGTKKTISDVQQTTNDLKKTTTEITEQAGKTNEKLTSVETKVNNDKAGGRNLALDSNVRYEKTDYLINQYSLTENFSTGEEYTFVIKGSVPQGQKFGIWQNGGSSNVGYAISVYANGITYVTFKAVAATSGNERKLSLYNSPSNTTKATVEWVALYKGNKPQDWTPAPENQVTTDEFTKKTNEMTKSVDGIKETITKVENSQSGFDKRVATVEKDATTIKQNVSSIQDTQTTQGRQLQEEKAGWENTAKALEGKVEIKQVEDYVAGFKIPDLKNTVNKNKEDLLAELANKLATEQFNQKVTQIDNRFIINERGINAAAKTTEVYTKEQANGQFATSGYVRDMESRLQLTEKGVSISVKENDVIAAFNMSKENITLNANRINLVGFITANHIKGQVLEGVTLKTSGNRNVEINQQNMKLFDSGKPRGYIGFMETTDGSIQPSFVLGSDNNKFSGTGSFYIYQATPRINGFEQPSKAWAKFGISKGENAVGTNVWSNYIQMMNDGGHMDVYSDGKFRFNNLNDIIFNAEGWAPGYGKFMVTTTEPHYFTNNYGEFNFQRKGSGNKIYFLNGANDHDFVLGRVMIRSSLVSGYDTGLQIKDTLGNGWRDIELRTLRAKENISATGGVWAREFIPNSSRKIKTNIEDLQFSALQTLNSVRIKKYNMISDVEKYDAGEIDVLPVYYGMIAEDSDSVFTTPEKNAVTLYSSVSITMQSVQELDWKADNMQFDIGMVKQALEAEKREKVFIQDQLYELKDLVVRQEDRIAKLEELLLQQLIDKKPEQL
ncbi:phage tail spike protein [Bacillus cereus]|uniref:Phage minor structural protein n=1 Tax=Bacillus cereus HuA3-9 TaxID=1053205 RepID=R8D7A5_BACCE|nr:phage tail spike protein [Bacillus cereus]EOO19716.1 phage minor structural protein [Bacillus cereus HuA3-9]